MPHLLLTAILTATSTTTATKSKSSSASPFLYLILVVFAAVYFFFLRPRQKKARALRTGAGTTLAVGDDIVTIGGILGTISDIDGDAITVEVAPGTHLSFLRRAVNLRAAVDGAPVTTATDATSTYDESTYDDSTYDESAYDDDATYDDDGTFDEEGWTDEEAAAIGDHPSGSTASDSTASDREKGLPRGAPGETGDGLGNEAGGRGEGR